jgi:hypothetical protein
LLALAVVVALSWAPSVGAPLGDNHEGRVDARFVLQVANLREDGISASGWGSSMAPYGGNYAHHPPGPNVVQLATSFLPGSPELEVRVFPYAMGLLALAAAAWLLRVVGSSWAATTAGVVVLVITPMFWTYGRLLWDVPLLFATPAAILSLSSESSRARVLLTSVLVAVTMTMSWVAGATSLAFIAVAAWRRRADGFRHPAALLAGAILGIAATGAWILAATDAQELADQVAERTAGDDFTLGSYVSRQLTWARDLYPPWLLVLVPVGIWRSTSPLARWVIATSGAVGLGFVVALPNGSFIHDYWSYPLLVTATVASAQALELIARNRPRAVGLASVTVGCAVVLALGLGPQGDSRFEAPEDAGRLAKRVQPADGQSIAWTSNGVQTARWLSVYWDLPARVLDRSTADRANDADLVLVGLPLPPELEGTVPVAVEGEFAVVRVADLRDMLGAQGAAASTSTAR